MRGEVWIHLPRPHPATLEVEELLKSCDIGKGRSGGPGGQNRNKVETLVQLLHRPTGVEAHAGERRSSMENRSVAIRRLRLALAVQVRTPVPLGEIRSPLWLARTRTGRISCSVDHQDFAALLAEELDVIVAAGLDARKAAMRLCVSLSQLLRLLKDHPPALARLNAARAGEGQHEYK